MAHDYPNAGNKAQPEVKEAVERFKKLPEAEREKSPLLFWLLGEGTPNYKVSAKDSEYADISTDKGKTCSNCEWYYVKIANNKGICSKIKPYVKPAGWCNLWTEFKDEGTRERDKMEEANEKIAEKIAKDVVSAEKVIATNQALRYRLGGGKPSRSNINKLIEAYALQVYSSKHKAPIRSQQKLYDKYMNILGKLSDRYPDYDLSSDSFRRQLERLADKWWNSRAMRGPGVDW